MFRYSSEPIARKQMVIVRYTNFPDRINILTFPRLLPDFLHFPSYFPDILEFPDFCRFPGFPEITGNPGFNWEIIGDNCSGILTGANPKLDPNFLNPHPNTNPNPKPNPFQMPKQSTENNNN